MYLFIGKVSLSWLGGKSGSLIPGKDLGSNRSNLQGNGGMGKHLRDVSSCEQSWQGGESQAGNGWSELGALWETVENQFPDAAWFSWEYSHISVIPDPKSCWVGLVPTTQSCSAGSVLVLPRAAPTPGKPSLVQLLPCWVCAWSCFSLPTDRTGQDPAPQLPAVQWGLAKLQVLLGARPALFQELHPKILPLTAFPGLGRGLGWPSSSLGMWHSEGRAQLEQRWLPRSRGDYPPWLGKSGSLGSLKSAPP